MIQDKLVGQGFFFSLVWQCDEEAHGLPSCYNNKLYLTFYVLNQKKIKNTEKIKDYAMFSGNSLPNTKVIGKAI